KQEMANADQLKKRQELYRKLLLPQAKQQAQAALLAYQSDRGDFADVMRAYIDDLNTRLDQQRIDVDRLKAKANILYFVPAAGSGS
ncbi:MAG: transporter, partial [Gammaproteobacteria bacterium]